MEFALSTAMVYTFLLYKFFYFNCNSTELQRKVWTNMNLRCRNYAQECSDGNFFPTNRSLQEALNVLFPPQNSNQPTDKILLK